MRLFRLVLILYIQIIFISIPLKASIPEAPGQQENFEESIRNYKQERWSVSQGLPVNTLLEIAQTRDGYLWISSFDGIVKFNGIKFELFSRKLLEVVKNNVCKALALDSEGRLWIGTHGSGLLYHENGKFVAFAKDQQFYHHINKLFIDSENRLWIGTISHGLYKTSGERIVPQLEASWLSDKTISSFAEGAAGELWIGTEGGGILRWQGDEKTRYTVENGLPSNLVFSLMMDSRNVLWVGTDRGVCTIDNEGVHPLRETSRMVTRAIAEDNQGHVWIGFDSGLGRFQKGSAKLETLGENNGFGHLSTKDIIVDREDNIWIATKFGELIQMRASNFTHLSLAYGVRGKTIYSISRHKNNSLLIASNEGYLDVLKGKTVTPYHLDKELIGKRIRHVMEDSKGRIWYSTYSGLLLENPDGSLRWFTEAKGFPENRVRLTFEDSKGEIWIGTRGSGLIKLNGMDFERIIPQGVSEGSLIMSIDEDSKGQLWVGTSGDGLLVLKDGKLIRNYRSGEGFISDIIFNTYIDDNGSVWVAANGGIAIIKDSSYSIFNTDNGLLSDSIYDIVGDSKANLWIPCNIGLMRIKKSEFNKSSSGAGKLSDIRLFGQYDGIQAPFTATSKALIDSEGVLWLPTFNGVVYSSTSSFLENRHQPICHITSITVGAVKKDQNENIVIEPSEKKIRFDYAALSLAAPLAVKFKTMLEGYDSDWSDINSDHSSSYTNLAPGEYKFKLMASNNDGVWSDPVSLTFYVAPSLWQQGWFVFLLICIVILILFSLEQMRINRIRKREKILESQVADRTAEIEKNNSLLAQQAKELQDKNDELESQKNSLKMVNRELESFSHVVSHDLRAPLNVMKGYLHLVSDSERENMDPQNYSFLGKMASQIKRMNSMISSLLEMSKASRKELERERTNLTLIAKDIIGNLSRSQPEREFHFQCQEGLQAECDETLIRIVLQNLLGNAWKYSAKKDKTKIEFGQINKNGKDIFYIRDNGAGFPSDQADELFIILKRLHKTEDFEGIGIGLNSVKRIIDRHGGQVWAEGDVGVGSTIFFTLG